MARKTRLPRLLPSAACLGVRGGGWMPPSASSQWQRGFSQDCYQHPRSVSVKILWNIIGVVLVLAGAVFFLQGVGVLLGSFMSKQTQWAVYGGIAFLAGAALLFYVNRRRVH